MSETKYPLNKYLTKEQIEGWFSYQRKPTPKFIETLFLVAAKDYKSKSIKHEDFTSICIYLYFYAIVHFSVKEEKQIPKDIRVVIEAFSDPHGDLVNSDGSIRIEKQDELLDLALRNDGIE